MECILEDFRQLGIELNPDWLAGLELCSDAPLTDDDVYMALVCSDLREACLSTSSSPFQPEKLRSVAQLSPGSRFCQITSCIDISISDAQRPRESSTSDKRMLKFTMHYSNGTSFDAVELEAIPNLPDNPEAGIKVILRGSPPVSNGIIFLESQHVHVVGGDIAALQRAQTMRNEDRLRRRDPLCNPRALREIQNVS